MIALLARLCYLNANFAIKYLLWYTWMIFLMLFLIFIRRKIFYFDPCWHTKSCHQVLSVICFTYQIKKDAKTFITLCLYKSPKSLWHIWSCLLVNADDFVIYNSKEFSIKFFHTLLSTCKKMHIKHFILILYNFFPHWIK